MSITNQEIKQFATDFFHTITQGGTADDQAKFFLQPYIMDPNGHIFDIHAHGQLHQHLINEKFEVKNVQLIRICDQPARARATATVYWEATYKSNPDQVIKAVVGENWIVERQPDNSLKFLHFHSTYFHELPESAAIQLDIKHYL